MDVPIRNVSFKKAFNFLAISSVNCMGYSREDRAKIHKGITALALKISVVILKTIFIVL